MKPVLALVVLLVRHGVASGQQPELRGAALDVIVDAARDSGFTGVGLIARGDSILWRRVVSSPDRPLTATTAFWIASITKSFTSVAVLDLVERQRLSLGDSLGRFFSRLDPAKAGITIRQLLTHTAGFGATYSGGGITEHEAAARAILSPPLAYEPGHGYRYGDDDYELLAIIVERVTDQSWDRWVQRRVLDRAGLRSTGFWCGRRVGVPEPVGGADGRIPPCTRADYGHRGANGMSSTAEDLLRWASSLRNGATFSRAAREGLTTPQVAVRREGPDDIATGFGSRVYSRDGRVTEVRLSGSGDNGHTSLVRIFPNGLTIVVLSNAGRPGDATWASALGERLASRE